MGEGLDAPAADRALAHPDENRIAQFAKDHRTEPRQAIGDDSPTAPRPSIQPGSGASPPG
jgi:hypothetical protein